MDPYVDYPETCRGFENFVHLGYYTQRVVAIPYRSFGTTCLSHLKMGQIGCVETSVRNYYYSLRNNPEERS
jgi:hypothetical protein